MSEELGPIATKVVFEDDDVRVWNQVVGAGANIEKHAGFYIGLYEVWSMSGFGAGLFGQPSLPNRNLALSRIIVPGIDGVISKEAITSLSNFCRPLSR